MPITASKSHTAQRAKALIEALAAALQRLAVLPGDPLVVESRIAQTKSLHVVVIWDAWIDLSPAERSKNIIDAYAKAKRVRGATITVAMGLTSEEALRMGFLPYSIITTRRQGDKASLDELAKAMVGAGGIVVKVGSSMQLRFPTLEQTEDAYRHLSQKVPGPYWAIVHEPSAAE
jgi:hypothetical protein